MDILHDFLRLSQPCKHWQLSVEAFPLPTVRSYVALTTSHTQWYAKEGQGMFGLIRQTQNAVTDRFTTHLSLFHLLHMKADYSHRQSHR